MTARRRFWPIPLLLIAAGCEWKTTSRVGVQLTAPLARHVGRRLVSVGGAAIRVQCPGGTVEKLGSTNADGWVMVTSKAPVRLDCDLAIDYRGHPYALVPVAEACSRKEGIECRVLEVRLMVEPGDGPSGDEPVAVRTRCEEAPQDGWVRCGRMTNPPTAEWEATWPVFARRASDSRAGEAPTR